MIAALLLACLPLPQASEMSEGEFLAEFGKLAATGDISAMAKLTKRNTDLFVLIFVRRADEQLSRPSDTTQRLLQDMGQAWSKAFNTDFCRNYERYLQMLDATRAEYRTEIKTKLFPDMHQKYFKAVEVKSPQSWVDARQAAATAAQGAESAGDLYYAAEARRMLGDTFHTDFNTESGDLAMALEHYRKSVEHRDRLGLKSDTFYRNLRDALRRVEELKGAAEAEEARTTVDYADDSEWLPLALQWGVDRAVGKVKLPSEWDDENILTWRLLDLRPETGWKAPLPGPLGEPYDPPLMVSRKGAKFGIDADADGQWDVEFGLLPKPQEVHFERIGPSGEREKFGLLVATGDEKSRYLGHEINYKPSDFSALMFFRSLAVATSELAEEKVTFYDTDSDGRFGRENPTVLHGCNHTGVDPFTGEKIWDYRFDSVAVGRDKKAQPLGKYLRVGESWYSVGSDDDYMANLRVREIAPSTGTIKLKFKPPKGLRLHSLVIAGQRKIEGALFDLADAKKGLTVPVGRYKVIWGLLYDSKRASEVVIYGGRTQQINVKEGEVTEITLGAPFRLAFRVDVSEDSVVVPGRSVHVVGTGQEVYSRLWPHLLVPNARMRVDGKKVAGGLEGRLLSYDEAMLFGQAIPELQIKEDKEKQPYAWPMLYYPADFVFPRPADGLSEVQLTLSKHPWFGKLASEWIQ